VGRGLGYEVAKAVVREGGLLALGDRLVQVETIRTEIDPSGDRSISMVCDITDEERCGHFIEEVDRRFARLDGIVHVAAMDRIFGGLMTGSLDDWDRAAAVNVRGTLALTKAAVPLMSAGGGGSVVVVSSIAAVARDAQFEMFAYAVSKGALRSAAFHLSRELGPLGIRVNTVAPGYKWGPVLETGYGNSPPLRAWSSRMSSSRFVSLSRCVGSRPMPTSPTSSSSSAPTWPRE
jgi:NAD(P)-dependent dehydrogenase (short-subunit alcohol dehydrogenase family)